MVKTFNWNARRNGAELPLEMKNEFTILLSLGWVLMCGKSLYDKNHISWNRIQIIMEICQKKILVLIILYLKTVR